MKTFGREFLEGFDFSDILDSDSPYYFRKNTRYRRIGTRLRRGGEFKRDRMKLENKKILTVSEPIGEEQISVWSLSASGGFTPFFGSVSKEVI